MEGLALQVGVLGVLGGLIGGTVAVLVRSLLNPRRKDLDELALDVEKIGRIVRRYHMSRVRAAASNAFQEGEPPTTDLDQGLPRPTPPAPVNKQQLRLHVAKLRSEGKL